MRQYTELVAYLLAAGPLVGDEVWRSFLPSTAPPPPAPMAPYHWVDCEGFTELCILAVGNGSFRVVPFFFPEPAPAAGFPAPLNNYYVTLTPVLSEGGNRIVSQIMPLTGIKAVGIEINNPTNGHATRISARAFLRGED